MDDTFLAVLECVSLDNCNAVAIVIEIPTAQENLRRKSPSH